MSLFFFIVLAALGLVGVINWVTALVRQIKAKSGWKVALSVVIAAASLVTGILVGRDFWTAAGVFLLVLAVAHQVIVETVATWVQQVVDWIKSRAEPVAKRLGL